jgi:tight adherence protein C
VDAAHPAERVGVTTATGAVLPWALGLGWGALVLVAVRRVLRRRGLRARAAALRPVARPRASTVRHALLAVVHRSGPVGRVARGLLRRRHDRRRDDRLALDLPVTIDVLSVAVAAGCTPYLAVEAAARWSPPSLAPALAEVLHASSLGVGFGESLERLGARLPRLRPLTRALLMSDRTGAPVAPALERLAAEERVQLRRRAEARARRVPVRLLFPLVFLVLPAFGLLTVVPALLTGFGRT